MSSGAPSRHFATQRGTREAPSRRWRDLENEDVILPGHGSGNEVILDYTLTQLAIDLRGTYEAQRPSTALALVAAGAGAVVLASMTLRKGAYPRIRPVPLVEPSVHRELAVIRRRDATLPPAAEPLYAQIVAAFRKIEK